MHTTPMFGLEVADGTDPVKQYPAAVDSPSKTKIDTLFSTGTGLRNVSSLMINGWTGGVYVTRVGSLVSLLMIDLISPATWNSVVIGTPPAGFMGVSAWGVSFNVASDVGLPNTPPINGSLSLLQMAGASLAAGTRIRGQLMYFTAQSWPTTLPGAPALLRDVLDVPGTTPA